MKLSRNQLIFNALFCVVLFGVVVWAFYNEYNRHWKQYQKKFNQLEYIKNKGGKIQQLWLQDIGEVDRCITCHMGAAKPEFSKEPQPFKTHSGDYLKYHPVEKYGCVVCHEGQGPALTVDAAHGGVKNWTKPILRGPFAQSSCGKCHRLDQRLSLSAELDGASVFIEGWKLFKEYNCSGCHKLSGYKSPDRIGPALTLVGSKVNRDWLISWLKNPKDYFLKTKMPIFTLSDEEIGYIADYLLSLNVAPSPQSSPLRREERERGVQDEGKVLVNELGCLGCHIINGNGSNFAPPFSNIGNKVKPDWLYQFLKNQRDYDPKTIIPDFLIPEEDIPKIVAYLMSLKKDKKFLTVSNQGKPSQKDIKKGRKLVKDLGCIGCHEIEKFPLGYDAPPLDGIGDKRVDELVFSNITDVDKTLINWLQIKVMDPKRFATHKIVTRMPTHDFNEKQAEALVTFLLSIRKDPVPAKYIKTLIDPDEIEMRGKNVLEKYNCLGCHKINKEGGNIGPELTNEAKKSRQEWLFTFIKSPYKIRPAPILKARMPNFNLSDKEVNTIIEYLASVSGEHYPYNLALKKEIYSEDIWNGEKLYQEIFACSGCHRVDGHGGEVGPEHTDIASRLKREWVAEWLKNPQAIQPDVRMPMFKFEDWQFEALTDYLMTLGKYRFIQTKSND